MQRDALEQLCTRYGFILLGLVDLGPEPTFSAFKSWLASGQQAGMHFLEQHQALRQDPRGLLPGAVQALIFALPYAQGDRLQAARLGRYRVAQYARLRDYHRVMRERGLAMLEELQQQIDALEGRVTIDSAPVLERALASRTMRGFIGKNTCYIHPEKGSLMLIGELLLTRTLGTSDVPSQIDRSTRGSEGGCGTCRRCQVNCPTGALDRDYTLDARKCLAYWTIEHRGTIPFEFWPWLPTYVFGCDLCQLACPYNRQTPVTGEAVRQDLVSPDLFELATLSQAKYESWLGGTPLTRAKREGLRRNALIALAVTQDERLHAALDLITQEDAAVLHETAEQIKAWRPG